MKNNKDIFLVILIFLNVIILYLLISLASSSDLTTIKSSPANAELFIPKISTGVDGKAESMF